MPASIRSWKRQEACSPRALAGSVVPPTPSLRTSGLHNHARINFFGVSSPVKLPLVLGHDNSRKLMHIVTMKTGNKNDAEWEEGEGWRGGGDAAGGPAPRSSLVLPDHASSWVRACRGAKGRRGPGVRASAPGSASQLPLCTNGWLPQEKPEIRPKFPPFFFFFSFKKLRRN